MVKKRLFNKLATLRKEISPPEIYGSEQPDIILIGYGSTYGVLKEVIDLLGGSHSIAMLHFSEVYPFPLSDAFDYLSLLKDARQSVCVELNATAQFARLLQAETCFTCTEAIHRYDGRPFTTESLLEEVVSLLKSA